MKSIKVKLTPVDCFDVEVDGVKIGRFEQESKWCGMLELRNPKRGTIIVSDDSSFIDKMFGDKSTIHCTAIKMSPDLIPTDKEDKS
jgi:hypothetical protein